MIRFALFAMSAAALTAPVFAQTNGPQDARSIADLLTVLQAAQSNNQAPPPPLSSPVDQRASSGPGVVEGSTTTAATPLRPKNADAPKFTGPTGIIAIGTLAAGTLSTTVISDYPGPWKGTLTQPIYSIDRKHVLFPEGTVVVGRVARVGGANEAINNRLALIPTELVRPDGMAFKINQNAVTDDTGVSGVTDKVDYHPAAQIGAIGAYGIIGALPDLIKNAGSSASNTVSLSNQQAGYILQKYLSLVPTVTVRAGSRFQIFFVEELEAPLGHTREPYQLTNYKARR